MKLLSFALLTFLFIGCATTQLETSSKLTKTIVIDHSKIVNKNIYLQVTNTANGGGEKMNLSQSIINSLQAKGYNIVDSSNKASYSVFINVLFANNLKEARAIQSGIASGIFGGAIAAGSGSNTGSSLLIGATAAIGGGLVGKALEDETFRAVIDITIKDNQINSEEKSRIYSEAVKMNLNLDEALPILEKESTRSIVNIF